MEILITLDRKLYMISYTGKLKANITAEIRLVFSVQEMYHIHVKTGFRNGEFIPGDASS